MYNGRTREIIRWGGINSYERHRRLGQQMILPKLQMAVECLDMEHQNQEQQVQWRRDKVQELCSKGEISQILQVGFS